MKSHKYVTECEPIGRVESLQLFLLDLKQNWYLEEIIIHRQVYLKNGEDSVFEQTFVYEHDSIQANQHQSVINITGSLTAMRQG
jgi:hypothetical protein